MPRRRVKPDNDTVPVIETFRHKRRLIDAPLTKGDWIEAYWFLFDVQIPFWENLARRAWERQREKEKQQQEQHND